MRTRVAGRVFQLAARVTPPALRARAPLALRARAGRVILVQPHRPLCAPPAGGASPPPPPPPPPPAALAATHSFDAIRSFWARGLLDDELSLPGKAMLSVDLAFVLAFDLPAFLEGSRGAYVAVSRCLYERRFAELEALVSAKCLAAMEQAMRDFGGSALRVTTGDAFDDTVQVRTAVLHHVRVLGAPSDAARDEGGEGEPPAAGQQWLRLDVRYEVDESFELLDEATGTQTTRLAGGVRRQRSVWSFESPLNAAAEPSRWKVVAIY
jgi:hypothetical protein